MATAAANYRRYFRLTPDRFVIGLLVVECLFWLSGRLGWPEWQKGYAVLITAANVGAAMLLVLLWFAIAVVFRWRFQFSIRSLLVLAVAVAVPCSWFAVEMKKANEQRTIVARIRTLGGVAQYDYNFGPKGGLLAKEEPPSPVWPRKLLGDDFFYTFVAVDLGGPPHGDDDLAPIQGQVQLESLNLNATNVSDHGFKSLGRMKNLRSLALCATRITDASLVHVGQMTKLEYLDLSETKIGDAGLSHLTALQRLQHLDLSDTKVTDAGMRYVARLRQLRFLVLYRCPITDAGLEHVGALTGLEQLLLQGPKITDAGLCRLTELRHLYWLNVVGTRVSDPGVTELQQALPNCKITNK